MNRISLLNYLYYDYIITEIHYTIYWEAFNIKNLSKIALTLTIVSSFTLAACSKENKEVTPSPTNSQTPTTNQGIVAGQIESKLVQTESTNSQVSFSFTLKNQTEKEKQFNFSDSCQQGYELLDSKGKLIDPTSVSCSQALTEFKLKPGEEKAFDMNFDNLPEGKYTLNAWLNYESKDKPSYKQTLSFEITPEQARYTVDGVFTGQIDNNSIEVKVKGDAQAYRLTEYSRDNLRFLIDGDKVSLSFSKNKDSQFILHSIFSKDASPTGQSIVGTYVELVNDNTVKIKTDTGIKLFNINEKMNKQVKSMEKNTKVLVSSVQNSKGDYIVTDITIPNANGKDSASHGESYGTSVGSSSSQSESSGVSVTQGSGISTGTSVGSSSSQSESSGVSVTQSSGISIGTSVSQGSGSSK